MNVRRSLLLFIVVIGLIAPLVVYGQADINRQFDITLRYEKGLGLFAIHKIEPGETLYRISKMYSTPLADIRAANKNLIENDLNPGQRIAIPFDIDRMVYEKSDLRDNWYYQAVFYKVSKKETIFRVSRKYFDTTVDAIKEKNDISGLKVDINQRLFIGWVPVGGKSPDDIPVNDPTVATLDLDEEIAHPTTMEGGTTYAFTGKQERGVAFWDKDVKTKGIFIMHRDAPKGTELLIENPMFDKRIQARVVGNIPPGAYPEDIIMIVSSDLAKELGALDGRFFVKVRYLQPLSQPIKSRP